MAVGKWKMYKPAKLALGKAEINFLTHTFKVAIFLSTSNANTLTTATFAALTNQHATANGYPANGVALTGAAWSGDDPILDFANAQFTAAGGPITGRFAVIYDDTHASKIPCFVSLLNTTPADETATDGNNFNINVTNVFQLNGGDVDA